MPVMPRIRTLLPPLRPEFALAVTFMVNGVVFASLLPRTPQIKAELGLSDATFGLALVGGGIGGLLGSVLAPRVVRRISERRAVIVTGVMLAFAGLGPALVATAPPPGVAPAVALGVSILFIGLSDSVHDVSMNLIALGLQRRRGGSIMSRLHALWSAGAVAAGAAGALAAARDVPLVLHLGLAGTVACLAQLLVAGRLPAAAEPAPQVASQGGVRLVGPWIALVVVAVGVVSVEGPPYDWAAIYLREHLGAGPGVAGLAPVSFTAAMLLSRLLADRWIDRWGSAAAARVAGLTVVAGSALGLWVSATTDWPLAGLALFAVVGWGAAPLFPLMFVAAERLPGVAHGSGVGAISAVARVGFLMGPPVVGAVSDAVGLAWGLSLIPLGAVVVAVLLPRQLAAATTGAAQDSVAEADVSA